MSDEVAPSRGAGAAQNPETARSPLYHAGHRSSLNRSSPRSSPKLGTEHGLSRLHHQRRLRGSTRARTDRRIEELRAPTVLSPHARADAPLWSEEFPTWIDIAPRARATRQARRGRGGGARAQGDTAVRGIGGRDPLSSRRGKWSFLTRTRRCKRRSSSLVGDYHAEHDAALAESGVRGPARLHRRVRERFLAPRSLSSYAALMARLAAARVAA